VFVTERRSFRRDVNSFFIAAKSTAETQKSIRTRFEERMSVPSEPNS